MRYPEFLLPLLAIAIILVLGTVYASQEGHLHSKVAKAIILIIAIAVVIMIFLGPAYFLISA